jgi:hypothetical protein
MVGKNLVVQFNGYPKEDIDDEKDIIESRLDSQEEPTSTSDFCSDNSGCLPKEATSSTSTQSFSVSLFVEADI